MSLLVIIEGVVVILQHKVNRSDVKLRQGLIRTLLVQLFVKIKC